MAAADLRAHARDGVVDDVAGVPAGIAAADFLQETLVQARALLGVRDLGVELQRVVVARLVGHAADRQVGRGRDDLEARRQLYHAVAVAHPHIEQAVALCVDAVFDVT